ncbi:PIG-L deacetylase family protein [Microbacterium sp. NPDC058389]|uniref:PIG-L deacetylase family protein n=1 Tax=Microbacterium sp. NPDC058389 TaxID=3346475 RepID=UPI00364E5016
MQRRSRILVVVAHPDEAEEYASGTIAGLADRGHHVKVLCATNGDAGHATMRRKPLAKRRLREAYAAADILGIAEYEVWDVHDGDLVASVELRKRMIRAIRSWRADVVITFADEGGGHPDNRAAAQLARAAAGLVTLPNQVPDVPPLEVAPVVVRMIDFGSIDQHRVDVVVDTTPHIERKLAACAAHASQFLEFAPHERGLTDLVPTDASDVDAFILEHWSEFLYTQPPARERLHATGHPDPDAVVYAETFELAPYGRAASADAVQALFDGRALTV